MVLTEWENEWNKSIDEKNNAWMSKTKQLTKLLKSINDLTSNKPRQATGGEEEKE